VPAAQYWGPTLLELRAHRALPCGSGGGASGGATVVTTDATDLRTLEPPLVESSTGDDAAIPGAAAKHCPLAAGDGRALAGIMWLGVALMVVIFAQTVYYIGWETSYSGRFWCDVAGR
jgi:hypothetical protein